MKRKLIEVALPLEAINEASAREKSIRHGHPSTLHLWWARRPLAAARAVIFAQMVDDPSTYVDVLRGDAKTKRKAEAVLEARCKTWQNAKALAEQEGDFDAHTRWALAWVEQSGFDEGELGVAEVLSKAKVTSVASMVDAGILASNRGKVRLRRPEELSDGWNPSTDARLTVLGGRKVDLRTAGDLSRHCRDDVVRTAELQYGR